ncbi:HNH endonuclease [Nesterenkonia alba]|uniref:HNH endonuclease n=1 Tax=Nesterenkonia alba TaxID=515814 RepID=UPI0012EC4425|nr:HNH endonuclease signature motif containing protein [Nesterenkonia alba]
MAQLDAGEASKRARVAAEMILERGSCTTSELTELAHLSHPPRALGDLRDSGVELDSKLVSYTDAAGNKKRQKCYWIVGTDPNKKSRRNLSKKTKDEILSSGRCEICGASHRLQADHRVPFEIAGETYPHVVEEFMPLCPSCNRAKSMTCENCPNRQVKDTDVCGSCMWASPLDYRHVATQQVREVRAVLEDPEDIERFDQERPDVQKLLIRHLRRADLDQG